jgi:hypothetical protein
MDFAEQTAGIKKVSNFGEFDVHILCVSTHKPDDMFIPQMDGLFQTTDKISREAKSVKEKLRILLNISSMIANGIWIQIAVKNTGTVLPRWQCF